MKITVVEDGVDALLSLLIAIQNNNLLVEVVFTPPPTRGMLTKRVTIEYVDDDSITCEIAEDGETLKILLDTIHEIKVL